MSDLYKFFDKMNAEDYDYVDKMEEEEVKKIAPYVLLGFAHGAKQNNMIHTLLTDIYCNEMVFSLSKHPKLLLKLFMAANGGIDNTRYSFKKPTGQEKKTEILAVARYYEVGYNEARDYLKILDEEEVTRIKEIYDSTQ